MTEEFKKEYESNRQAALRAVEAADYAVRDLLRSMREAADIKDNECRGVATRAREDYENLRDKTKYVLEQIREEIESIKM